MGGCVMGGWVSLLFFQFQKKKKQMIKAGAQPEIFQGRGGFAKLGHLNKHFIKKSRKKTPQGKMLEFFS